MNVVSFFFQQICEIFSMKSTKTIICENLDCRKFSGIWYFPFRCTFSYQVVLYTFSLTKVDLGTYTEELIMCTVHIQVFCVYCELVCTHEITFDTHVNVWCTHPAFVSYEILSLQNVNTYSNLHGQHTTPASSEWEQLRRTPIPL